MCNRYFILRFTGLSNTRPYLAHVKKCYIRGVAVAKSTATGRNEATKPQKKFALDLATPLM